MKPEDKKKNITADTMENNNWCFYLENNNCKSRNSGIFALLQKVKGCKENFYAAIHWAIAVQSPEEEKQLRIALLLPVTE